MTKRRRGCAAKAQPDMEETKAHVLAAGRELMLAAQGALGFCKDYAKAHASPSSKSQLMSFFSKALEVADELSKGLITASSVHTPVRGVADKIFDAIGNEMKEDARTERKAKVKHKAKRKRRTSRGRG